MLIIYDKELGKTVVAITKENNIENASDHIKNGYPNLIEEWVSGKLEAHIIPETAYSEVKYVTVSDAKAEVITDKAARDAVDLSIATARSKQAELDEFEKKVQAEIRALAIASLKARGEKIPE